MIRPRFKKWLSDDEKKQNETSTSTGDVAGFSRHVLSGPVRRQWLGPWAEEDPFFKKKKKKNEEAAVQEKKKTKPHCSLCKNPTRQSVIKSNGMCERCALTRASSG